MNPLSAGQDAIHRRPPGRPDSRGLANRAAGSHHSRFASGLAQTSDHLQIRFGSAPAAAPPPPDEPTGAGPSAHGNPAKEPATQSAASPPTASAHQTDAGTGTSSLGDATATETKKTARRRFADFFKPARDRLMVVPDLIRYWFKGENKNVLHALPLAYAGHLSRFLLAIPVLGWPIYGLSMFITPWLEKKGERKLQAIAETEAGKAGPVNHLLKMRHIYNQKVPVELAGIDRDVHINKLTTQLLDEHNNGFLPKVFSAEHKQHNIEYLLKKLRVKPDGKIGKLIRDSLWVHFDGGSSLISTAKNTANGSSGRMASTGNRLMMRFKNLGPVRWANKYIFWPLRGLRMAKALLKRKEIVARIENSLIAAAKHIR